MGPAARLPRAELQRFGLAAISVAEKRRHSDLAISAGPLADRRLQDQAGVRILAQGAARTLLGRFCAISLTIEANRIFGLSSWPLAR
jgi:hypothetical protein